MQKTPVIWRRRAAPPLAESLPLLLNVLLFVLKDGDYEFCKVTSL